ncbi:hypothetical protein AC520_3211 [Enterobacter sp. OLF]|nr:hypothetical protein AC520_3211 [Enterobacter sp. OLF]
MPVFNLLILFGFYFKTAVNAAVSTCHFDSIDIVTPWQNPGWHCYCITGAIH